MSQPLRSPWKRDYFSSTFQCGEDFPRDSEWARLTLNLQVNTDEWQKQPETIQALADSKVGLACYSCTVAFSHNLPLHCSLARSQSPTRLHSLPQLSLPLSFARALSLTLHSHLSSTYLMSFNYDRNSPILAASPPKWQVILSLQTFKMSQYKMWLVCIPIRYIGRSTSCVSCLAIHMRKK